MTNYEDTTRMNNSNIEFISYTGAYPSLCCGVLTVNVNGKKYKFRGYERSLLLNEGDDYYPEMLPKFWISGGHGLDEDLDENLDEFVNKIPWGMSPLVKEDNYPKEIWECLNDLLEIFNKNVPWGCCRGCL